MAEATTTTEVPAATAAPAELTRDQVLASLSGDSILEEIPQAEAFGEQPEGDDIGVPEKAPETPAEAKAEEATPAKEEPKAPTVEELAAEKKKLEAERAELETKRKELDAKATASKREIELSEKQAEQLEAYAKEWDESGDKELAANARARADRIRAEVKNAKTEAARTEFRQAQETVLRQVVTEFPELTKPDSQMTKDMDALLRSRPALLTYPEGIRDAANFLASKTAAGRLQAAQDENAKLKEQVADLQRRLQPATKGQATAPRGETPFARLPPAEQRALLLKQMRGQEVTA
jgi:chromosome segregation ATPase